MYLTKRWKQGQSTAEYAIVIAVVLGAIVGMQTYVKRAINARIADASDYLPDTQQTLNAATRRYQMEPSTGASKSTTTSELLTASGTAGPLTTVLTLDATTGISKVAVGNGGEGALSKTTRPGKQVECATGETAAICEARAGLP